jgi:pilus assembly protein CpaF
MGPEGDIAVKIKEKLMDQLEYKDDVSDETLKEIIGDEIREYNLESHIPIKERMELGRQIFHSMRKLDILQDLIEDPSITEIMINGPDNVFAERNGRLSRLNVRFESEESLRSVIGQIVSKCNRVVNDSVPIVDARLTDGSRVNVVLNPVAINGPILTIRRFPKKPYLMDDLIRIGSLSKEAAQMLKDLVTAGYNIIISGGTGSGKTTFLNALSAYIPSDERIITIEDSAELQIQGIDNLVRMETKNGNSEGSMPITIRDLIKASLRMRPDRIIVGEVRGGEAMDMVCSAMNCGHDGSMSTVHSNSAADTIARLETMILMAVELPVHAIRRQICSGVDIIVHLSRMRDKSRKVVEIVELLSTETGEVKVNPIYVFKEDLNGNKRDLSKVEGSLIRTGSLKDDKKLKNAGIYIDHGKEGVGA